VTRKLLSARVGRGGDREESERRFHCRASPVLRVGPEVAVGVQRLLDSGVASGALRGRSHCLGCHRTLRWYELVPIASYAVQGGRCRVCGARIGREALVVEMVGAAAGALVVLGVVGLVVLLAG
jgi:prepilin signal peptidase PulO-like enzyme (type II secretory pathway)